MRTQGTCSRRFPCHCRSDPEALFDQPMNSGFGARKRKKSHAENRVFSLSGLAHGNRNRLRIGKPHTIADLTLLQILWILRFYFYHVTFGSA